MVEDVVTVFGFPNLLLNVITLIGIGITAVLWIFKRGKESGMDEECENRIRLDIKNLKDEFGQFAIAGDAIHAELKADIQVVNNKIDSLKGSFDTFKEIVIKKL